MLKELLKNYKKQTIKVAIRMVYYQHYGCSISSLYDSND